MKLLCTVLVLCVGLGCGSDENEADRFGVAAECSSSEDCQQDPIALSCLPQSTFKGGYCGVQGCSGDLDCPEGARCVTHDDNVNYCFRICADKSECNANRTPENEANCSSNITFADTGAEAREGDKACVPPSGS